MPATTTNRALAQTVAIFDPLEIAWEVSVDGQNWCPAGISQNQSYVTFDVPSTRCIAHSCSDPIDRPLYHTLIHLGSQGATGYPTWLSLTNERKQIINSIWENVFATMHVERVNGSRLTYYATEHALGESLSTHGLLQYGDGNCDAWAKFFLDTLRAQGITYDNIPDASPLVRIASADQRGGLLIKHWNFTSTPRASENPAYPYLNIATHPIVNFSGSGVLMNWFPQTGEEEVHDVSGIAGQGTQNPLSLFPYHAVISIQEENEEEAFYDPSYGRMYTGGVFQTIMEDFWNTAITGLYRVWDSTDIVEVNEMNIGIDGEDLDGNGMVENQTVIIPNQNHPDLVPYPIKKPTTYGNDLRQYGYRY